MTLKQKYETKYHFLEIQSRFITRALNNKAPKTKYSYYLPCKKPCMYLRRTSYPTKYLPQFNKQIDCPSKNEMLSQNVQGR